MPEPDPPIVAVLSGPSGAGKDTILHGAMDLDPSLATVATAKTRPPRRGEVHGVHHQFLSEREFDEWLAAGRFLEHATVYGHRSGVPREAVEAQLQLGKSVIIRTDVQGARTLRGRLPDALLVFVTVPDASVLRGRMLRRGTDSESDMEVRLAEAEAEMSEASWFDAVILNEDGRERAAAESLVAAIAEARRARAEAPSG